MVLATTKEYLSSKEVMPNYENHYSTRDGLRIKTFGHLIMISNGPREYAISTSSV